MKEVSRWQSKNGELFESQWECICHEKGISQEVANTVLIIYHNQLSIDTSNYETVLKSLELFQQFGLKIST